MFKVNGDIEGVGIYYIKCIINSKIYIGSSKDMKSRLKQHFKSLEKGNHVNILLQRSYDKHLVESFECGSIETCKVDDLFIREQYYIDELDCKNRNNGYNIADANGGDTISCHPNRDEIIERSKESRKKYWDSLSKSDIEKLYEGRGQVGEANGMYGRHHSEETKQQISETLNNTISKMTEEERKGKWSRPGKDNGMYGRTHTEEARRKISEANKGRKLTEETKEKISISLNETFNNMTEEERKEKWGKSGKDNNFYGKTHTEETKKKLSEKRKGKKPSNMRKVEIEGVIYESLNEASRVTGIKTTTIWHRIKSKNDKYKNYNYVV